MNSPREKRDERGKNKDKVADETRAIVSRMTQRGYPHFIRLHISLDLTIYLRRSNTQLRAAHVSCEAEHSESMPTHGFLSSPAHARVAKVLGSHDKFMLVGRVHTMRFPVVVQ